MEQPASSPSGDLLALALEMVNATRLQQDRSQTQNDTIIELRREVAALTIENTRLRRLVRAVAGSSEADLSRNEELVAWNGSPGVVRVVDGEEVLSSKKKRGSNRTICKAPVPAPNWPGTTGASIGLSSDAVRTPGAGSDADGRGLDRDWPLRDDNRERRSAADDEQELLTPRCSASDARMMLSSSKSSSTAALDDVGTSSSAFREQRSGGVRRRTSRSFDDHALIQRGSSKTSITAQQQQQQQPYSNGALRDSSRQHRMYHGGGGSGSNIAQLQVAASVSRPAISLSFELESRFEEQIVHDICRYFDQTVARCQRSARTIQRHYRQYRLAKRVQILRSARRSGTFRRLSGAEVPSDSPFALPNLKHLQRIHRSALAASSSPTTVPRLINEEEEEEYGYGSLLAQDIAADHRMTQHFEFDDAAVAGHGEADDSPPGYSADDSSVSSSFSFESTMNASASIASAGSVHLHQLQQQQQQQQAVMESGALLNYRNAGGALADASTGSLPAFQNPHLQAQHVGLGENGDAMTKLEQRNACLLARHSLDGLVPQNGGSGTDLTRPRERKNSVFYEVRPLGTPTTPGLESSESKVRKQRKLRIGITHFNRKPDKGVAYLISKRLLSSDPRDIAVFIKKQGGLSRKMVGDYLGRLQDPLCQSVLREYVNTFKFDGLTFVQALRKFLSTFHIPGEAQKIEKILELFAGRYASCNSDRGGCNPDTCFIMSFSTIMLNTDLHNVSVKTHMTKEQFIRNNRGIDDGKDLPADFLVAIYDDIAAREFVTPKDHVQQVLSLQKSIVGNCPPLATPHRQLVHVARLFEVSDKDRKQPPNVHSRFLFLFNDLLLVAKYAPKKSLNTTYVYKASYQLLDIKVEEFSNAFYKNGVLLRTVFDDKTLACFNGEKEAVTKKFVCDLKEVLLEISEMEQERMQDMDELAQRGPITAMSPDVTRLRRASSPKRTKASPSGLSPATAGDHADGAARNRSRTLPSGKPGLSPSPDSGEGAQESRTNIFGSLKGRTKKKKGSVQATALFGNN